MCKLCFIGRIINVLHSTPNTIPNVLISNFYLHNPTYTSVTETRRTASGWANPNYSAGHWFQKWKTVPPLPIGTLEKSGCSEAKDTRRGPTGWYWEQSTFCFKQNLSKVCTKHIHPILPITVKTMNGYHDYWWDADLPFHITNTAKLLNELVY